MHIISEKRITFTRLSSPMGNVMSFIDGPESTYTTEVRKSIERLCWKLNLIYFISRIPSSNEPCCINSEIQ